MEGRYNGLEAYIDEERALEFHVWVAELELLVGTAKERQVDQASLLYMHTAYNAAMNTNERTRPLGWACCPSLHNATTSASALLPFYLEQDGVLR